ncbi:Fic family protein [Mammaliicoccus sp. Dog046]|uniref:Fic family protein n=1 Tax=Mammaliicoccus sp. Dog046 TaxID=3034233 RepID=UPI002B25F1ED|nr:Fic family protein [Mammaliicoccus sp. Dog046]WQK84508.1 Fic family protein [Mammaliicoccus sp. Dog046]
MKYKSLKTVFHMLGVESAEAEYEKRINHFSSYVSHLNIHPMKDQQQMLNLEYHLFYCMTNEIVENNEKILLNSAKILELSSNQPGIATEAYIKHLLINELQSTNETENIRSTKQEIAEALNNINGHPKRFTGLVNQYLLIKEDNVELKSIADIRSIYDTIVSREVKEDEQPDGKLFRKESIGVYDESNGKWVHRNEYNESQIFEYLTKILDFIEHFNSPKIAKIMASHYMFEYLHPFYDGNGRIGRYLVAKLLNEVIDPFTSLTFSYVVNKNKSKYYKVFEDTSHYFNKGDLTIFIQDMLKMLIEGQENIISSFEENIEIINNLQISLNKMKLDKYESKIFFILLQDKVFGSSYARLSLKELEKITGFSRGKINSVIQLHTDKLVKIKSKPTIYEIKESFIYELLSQPLEDED